MQLQGDSLCTAALHREYLLYTSPQKLPILIVSSLLHPAGAALLAGYAVGRFLGIDEVTSATYLVSSALCIAAIACLSRQESARTGNALGLVGVTGGIVATLGGLNTDPGTYAQVWCGVELDTSRVGTTGGSVSVCQRVCECASFCCGRAICTHAQSTQYITLHQFGSVLVQMRAVWDLWTCLG